MSLLRIDGISKSFGGLKAVDEISFEVQEGTIHALIGPNGAGKTTLVNMISGIYTVDSGDIYFDNEKNIALLLFPKKVLHIFFEHCVINFLSIVYYHKVFQCSFS